MSEPTFQDYLDQAKEIEHLKALVRTYQERNARLERELMTCHDKLMMHGVSP